MLQFGDIEPFLTVNTDIGPSLRPKMLQNNSLEDYVESCIMLQYNNYYIRYFVGIFGHNIGHNRAKTVAMPNSIFGGKIGIIRWCLTSTYITCKPQPQNHKELYHLKDNLIPYINI